MKDEHRFKMSKLSKNKELLKVKLKDGRTLVCWYECRDIDRTTDEYVAVVRAYEEFENQRFFGDFGSNGGVYGYEELLEDEIISVELY
jgi:hypothetical protein